MKPFAFALSLVLLGFALPATAQIAADPADFLPANVPLYLEVPSDQANIEQFQSLFDSFMRMGNNTFFPTGTSIIDVALNPSISVTLPEVEFERDIVPWLGGNRVGMAVYGEITNDASSQSEYVLALPIGDANAAFDFFSALATEQVTVINNIAIYEVGLSHIASSDAAIWIGSPDRVEQMIRDLPDGLLSSADWYSRVKSQLPADPLVSGYVNGEWAAAQVARQEATSPPDAPSAAVLIEAVLRIHPAESAMEDALLQFPPFVGAGFALDYTDGRLDITGAAVLDSIYPAPTLSTATAGAGLLDVIPPDSIVVFDSYDPAILSGFVGYLALIGPAIGQIYDNIIFQLENPGAPTPTPTPTPTPLPPPTADDLIAQAQPIIQQAEAVLGMSLDELYSLINGEFAIAYFPSEIPPTTTDFGTTATPGFALYLQTSDAARLLGVISKSTESLSTLMSSPFAPAPSIQFETEIIDGVEVTYVGVEEGFIRAVYGILDGDILFFTIEPYLEAVLNGASNDASITQTRAWHNDVYEGFGTGQDALFFIDISKYMSMTWSPYNPATPPDVGQFLLSMDIADDGVFLIHAAWLLEP